MIQTIIFLSITTIVFMILFIVTYAKYRTLQYEIMEFLVDTAREILGTFTTKRRDTREVPKYEGGHRKEKH